MTSTPPQTTTIRTPPTPLHGPLYDSPPYHSLRKSSRLTKPTNSDCTPSPTAANSFDSEGPGELKRTPKSQRSRVHLSPPSSPIETDEMVATTRAGSRKHAQMQSLAPNAASSLLSLGLPTPVKTPRKKPLHPSSGAAARILFPGQQRDNAESPMATPSKRGKRIKKHVGFSLDDEMENGGIEIYTDSKEKIPEVDDREDNPFYVKDKMTRKVSNKRKREPELERQLDRGVAEMDNDRGMVYVFRGRRIYKRFDGPNPATRNGRDGSCSPLHDYSSGQVELLDDADTEEGDLSTRKHFTRSSIKPRRLFNSEAEDARPHRGTTTDEEAVTDLEDPEHHGLPSSSTASKGKAVSKKTATIKDGARSLDAPPSPFDSWPRRKSAREASGTKREGDTLQSGAKRAREAHN